MSAQNFTIICATVAKIFQSEPTCWADISILSRAAKNEGSSRLEGIVIHTVILINMVHFENCTVQGTVIILSNVCCNYAITDSGGEITHMTALSSSSIQPVSQTQQT